MMTMEELRAKNQIENSLGKQGYPTYARIFHKFDLNLTNDPEVIAYMEPNRFRIVVNRGLDLRNVSTVIRHEILHHYLEHESRLLKHLAQRHGLDYSKLTDKDINELKNELYRNDTFNIAADYEISNVGYTEEDKNLSRSIVLNGETISALVTEDDHPDWVDLSVEDMYDKLRDEIQDDQNMNTSGQGMSSDRGQPGQEGQGQGNSGQGDGDPSNGQSQSGAGQKQGQGKDDQPGQSKKSQRSDKGGPGRGAPQIGDKGNPDVQAAEDLARAAAAVLDDVGNELEDEDIEDLKKAVEEARAAIKSGSEAQVEQRMVEMENLFDDNGLIDELKDEVKQANARQMSEREKARAERELERFKQSGIYKFKMSLNKFLTKEISDDRDSTWRKFNKTYVGSNIVKPGRNIQDAKIPLINIYFDMSGSWGPEKIAVGESAMAQIFKLQNAGKLKANVYYFSNVVFTDMYDKRYAQEGTNGQPIMEHIRKTKPDNVIIMTDSDISDITENTVVPGAVWLLFKDGRSKNLIEHIKGKKETHIMDI